MKKILTLLFIILISNTYAQQNLLYPFSPDGKKWGVCDDSLNVIVEPIYDQEFNFFDRKNFSFVYLNRRIGAINDKGNVLFACKYDKAETYSLNNEVVAKVSLKDKEGLLSLKTNKILLPLNYDKIHYDNYGDDIVSVWQNRKSGFVHVKTGKPIGKIEYTYVQKEMDENNNVIVGIDYKKGLLNLKTGKLVLPLIYDKIIKNYKFNPERTLYKAEKDTTIFIFDANGIELKRSIEKTIINDDMISDISMKEEQSLEKNKEQYIKKSINFYKVKDKSWKVTVENRIYNSIDTLKTFTLNGYDTIYRYANNFEDIDYPYAKNILFAVKDGKMGLIDLSNNIKVPCIYDTIKYQSKMHAYLMNKEKLWGILNYETYKEIVKPFAIKIEELSSYNYYYNITKVHLPKGQIGYVNFESGKVYIPGISL